MKNLFLLVSMFVLAVSMIVVNPIKSGCFREGDTVVCVYPHPCPNCLRLVTIGK
jgi:hypothetical protein